MGATISSDDFGNPQCPIIDKHLFLDFYLIKDSINHRIIELFRLEKPSRIIQSNQ